MVGEYNLLLCDFAKHLAKHVFILAGLLFCFGLGYEARAQFLPPPPAYNAAVGMEPTFTPEDRKELHQVWALCKSIRAKLFTRLEDGSTLDFPIR